MGEYMFLPKRQGAPVAQREREREPAARKADAIQRPGQQFLHRLVPEPVLELETRTPAAFSASQILQRKLEFEHDGKFITKVNWTRRPGWSSDVKAAMPSVAGYDKGHVDPWLGIKMRLANQLLGANKAKAAAVLSKEGYATDSSADWDTIEANLKQLGKDLFNDLDHLEYEDSSANRSSGAKLPGAADIAMEVYKVDGNEPDYPYEVTDTDGSALTLSNKKEAEAWLTRVGVPDTADEATRKAIIAKYKKARTPSGGIACTIL